jgi:hypothetical protein
MKSIPTFESFDPVNEGLWKKVSSTRDAMNQIDRWDNKNDRDLKDGKNDAVAVFMTDILIAMGWSVGNYLLKPILGKEIEEFLAKNHAAVMAVDTAINMMNRVKSSKTPTLTEFLRGLSKQDNSLKFILDPKTGKPRISIER